MRVSLVVLLLCGAVSAQAWFNAPGTASTYHAAILTNNVNGLFSVARHFRSNGDGTITAYSFAAISALNGDSFTISNTSSCYDMTANIVGTPGSVTIELPGDGVPQNYRTYVFTSACAVLWDFEYDDDPGIAQAFGLIWRCYRRATDHSTSAGVTDCSTSSDNGASWSLPTTIISDHSGGCSLHDCDLRGASSLSALPDGSLIIWLTRFNWTTGALLGTYWSRCTANCTLSTSWPALTRFTAAISGISTPLNTLPYGRIFTMPDGVTLAKWLHEDSGVKSVLAFSCDGGINWNTGCDTQTQVVIDNSGTPISLPTEETAPASFNGNIVAFSRCASSPSAPPCPLWLLTSTDGLHFVKTATGLAPTDAGTTSTNQVSPYMVNSLPGQMTLCLAERENAPNEHMRCLTFAVADAIANPAGFNRTTVLWNGIVNDWGYPALAFVNNTLVVTWYSWVVNNSSVATLYNMVATFDHLRGTVQGMLNGVLLQ